MTDKQLNILQAALMLFALEGFNATSTSRIAKEAGVSEGLIFRHFGSKEGLLQAVLDEGRGRASAIFQNIFALTDPQARIEAVIALPFEVPEADYDFWRLQFKLKWELQHKELSRGLEPLKAILTDSFEQLGYAMPAQAAEYMMHHFNGVTSALLKNEITDRQAAYQYWLDLYRSPI